MAVSFLRKIILEEIKNTLKEELYTPEERKKLEDEAAKEKRAAESDFAEKLRQQRLKRFGEDPDNMAQQDREEWVQKNAPYSAGDDEGQVGYSDESNVLAQLKSRKSGVVCTFATTIQGLIRDKIKLTSPALMGRVKDGRMGYVTSSIINFVIDYGNKNNLDTQGLTKIPLSVKGYKNVCFSTTPQQKQKLIELFNKIPVKVVEKATQMATQVKPEPVPGEQEPPEAPPAQTPTARFTSRVPTYRSKFNVGDVQMMDDMPYNVGVWDGNDFISIGAAKDKAIKIRRASLNPQILALLEKNPELKGMLYESLLKKEITKLLKQI